MKLMIVDCSEGNKGGVAMLGESRLELNDG